MDWQEVRSRLTGPAALVSATFRDDYSLDLEALERNVAFMVDHGIGRGTGFFIAPCGDGEYVTLSPKEHLQIVETCVRVGGGRVPVVAGVATTDFRVARELAQSARNAGAIAIMFPPPFYYPLNQDAIIDWYERLAGAVDIGIMVYDQSWRGPFVNALVGSGNLEQLLRLPNVVAIKHSGLGDLMEQMRILDQFGDRIAYIDSTAGFATTVAHMHGASGFISGTAAWWPEFELRYWALLQEGRYAEAEREHSRLAPFVARFHRNSESGDSFSLVAVHKAALEYVGLAGGPVRPPFRELTSDQKAVVFGFLEALEVPRGSAIPA
jgi:dihydrodipicolinate synthase/N-acetylneuraminate lyase